MLRKLLLVLGVVLTIGILPCACYVLGQECKFACRTASYWVEDKSVCYKYDQPTCRHGLLVAIWTFDPQAGDCPNAAYPYAIDVQNYKCTKLFQPCGDKYPQEPPPANPCDTCGKNVKKSVYKCPPPSL